MAFNPNKLPKKEYVWATYIPNRRPQFKLHANQSQATSALKYRSEYVEFDGCDYTYKYVPDDCTLWQMLDGKWKEIDFKRRYNYIEGEKLL